MRHMRRDIPYFQTDSQELSVKDIMSVIMKHKKYEAKYKKNEDYYDGKHKILEREFADPTKPNNKVVVDLPAYTVDIRVGYFSGEPVSFRSVNEEQNNMIQDLLKYNDFQEVNSELDTLSSIYGHAFLVVYLDEDGNIRFGVDDPYNTLVIHDSTIEHNIIGALRYYEYEDVIDGMDKIRITLYTKKSIQQLDGPINAPQLISSDINIFGEIPIIEFMENSARCGSFEKHISIVDAIESIMSNNINEIDYFDNAYLHLKGVVDDINELNYLEGDPFGDMKNNRVLVTLADGGAEFLTKNINDVYIQNTLNRLTDDYHKLTKTPALNNETFGNASGVALRYKLFNLEKDLNKKESKWRKSIQRLIDVVNNIWTLKGHKFNPYDVTVTFTRSLPNNEAEMADIVTKLNGIVSRRTLLSQLDFIEDVEAEIEQLDKELRLNELTIPEEIRNDEISRSRMINKLSIDKEAPDNKENNTEENNDEE